jgi:1,4-dihydroxy-2-naphthoate octaprenyltransferase
MWLLQLSTHFLNEYYDRGRDQANLNRTLFSGGSGVLADKRLKPIVAIWAGVGTTILAIAMLVTLNRIFPTFGMTTIVLFSLAAIGALGYSVPPLALVERGLGDLDATLIVALLVPLFGYSVQTGQSSLTIVLTYIPLAALILANMLIVAFPDFEADRRTGKRTLVVILGPDRAARLYAILLAAGYMTSCLTLALGVPLMVLICKAATLPIAALSLWEIWRGGYKLQERYARNTFIGISVVGAFGLAEIIGLLLTNVIG